MPMYAVFPSGGLGDVNIPSALNEFLESGRVITRD